MPRPWYSGWVAVSTARTACTIWSPRVNSQRMSARKPAMRPPSHATHAGDAPKAFSSCFHA